MSHSNERMMAIAIRKSLLKETSISNYSSGSNGNEAWASVSCSRAVYMNDGDEFQIQLFNPEDVTVGCTIYINGKLISQRKIVLRPGERVWLDRYIDTPNKLKFSTYEVGKSKAAQQAIKNNGDIKVDFYKEQEIRPTISYQPTITYQPHIFGDYSAGDFIMNARLDDGCTNNLADVQTCLTAAVNACDIQCKAETTARKMETGRVEHGGHSDQSFNQVYQEFESFPYHSEEVKILPMSQKPVRPDDLKRRFCPYCGKKIKEGFIYCPNCGRKL